MAAQPKLSHSQWNEVKERYEAGERNQTVAADYGVSDTAIRKKAKKEGWRRPNGRWTEPMKATETARMLADPQTNYERLVAGAGSRTLARGEVYLDAIREGASQNVACKLANIDHKTIKAWCADDPEFEALIHDAKAQYIRARMRDINTAAGRDWKASAYMLERHEDTAEQFSRNGHGGTGGMAIQVNINVPIPQAVEAGDRPTIDVTAREISEDGE